MSGAGHLMEKSGCVEGRHMPLLPELWKKRQQNQEFKVSLATE